MPEKNLQVVVCQVTLTKYKRRFTYEGQGGRHVRNHLGRTGSPASGSPLYGTFLIGVIASLIGNLVIRMGARGGWLPPWGQVTLAALATLPLFVAVGLFWRLLRSELDEMLQKIVLEGLATAFIVYLPLTALYVNLRTAGVPVPRLDPPDLVLAPAVLTAIGIAIARRRYQ